MLQNQRVKNYWSSEWVTVLHPPYSPDSAPTDYHLFRSLSNLFDARKSSTTQNDLEMDLLNFFG